MRTFSVSTLERLGINLLTGEACAFSQRILCDLNASGVDLVCEWLGMRDIGLVGNWNSTVNDEPAIKSIMLDRHMLTPLLVFAALREGYEHVVLDSDTVLAFNNDDLCQNPGLHNYMSDPKRQRWHNPRKSGQPRDGTRNVHAFTGRSL